MGNEIKDTVEVIEGIVKAVPIYDDLAKPTVQKLGRALDGSIRLFLAPVSGLIWGYDKIANWLPDAISEKLNSRGVPEERVITPAPSVAGPAIEAMRFVGNEPALREMYANLLATAMDSATANQSHPSFVEIIKQLTPDEAKIIKYLKSDTWYPVVDLLSLHIERHEFDYLRRNITLLGDLAGVSHSQSCPSYIDNLQRLGLITINEAQTTPTEVSYALLEMDAEIVNLRNEHEKLTPDKRIHTQRRSILLTEFGSQFCRACVHESPNPQDSN
jgi:hypothetical protein